MHVVALVCSLNVSSVLPTHKAISLSVFARLVAATTPGLAFRHGGLNDPCCSPSGAEAAPTRARTAVLCGMDIMFRFFPGTEAVTTLLRAFPFAGISDLRIRVVPRELGGPHGAPTTNTMTRLVRTGAITRSLSFRMEALTTLLLAIWCSHEADSFSDDATPTITNGRYLCHTMVYGSG
jgi:hypothetical protein